MQLKKVKTYNKAFFNLKKPFLLQSRKKLKLALAASAFLFLSKPAPTVHADEVAMQYLSYDESNNRVYVDAYSFDLKHEIGTDDVLDFNYTHDAVSGATPTWSDTSSGGSQKSVGVVKETGNATPIVATYDITPFGDTRDSADVLWTHRFANRDELALGVNLSSETDFLSYGGSANYLKNFNQANTNVSIGASYIKNEVTPNFLANTVDTAPIVPNLFMDTPTKSFETFNVFNVQGGVTQLLTKNSFVNVSVFYSRESGYLQNPYLRVVREYNVAGNRTDKYIFEENRPRERNAYGFTANYVQELISQYDAHLGYRFYRDNWKIQSHTIDVKLYAEVIDNFTLIPSFRYYSQTKAYFYGNLFHEKFATRYSTGQEQEFASSDFRVGAYDAREYGLGLEYKFNNSLKVNVNSSIYQQTTGLRAFVLTTGFNYIF
ncbi:MAG: DUF3570 domain-containing protein [Nitrospinae bacterium]|nr:DUF3570 domain-containing protein [Nitrospinota bacterium]